MAYPVPDLKNHNQNVNKSWVNMLHNAGTTTFSTKLIERLQETLNYVQILILIMENIKKTKN